MSRFVDDVKNEIVYRLRILNTHVPYTGLANIGKSLLFVPLFSKKCKNHGFQSHLLKTCMVTIIDYEY